MIDVIKFENILSGSRVKLIASYFGYSDYADQIDNFIGQDGIVFDVSDKIINIKFNNLYSWWYPPYSLEFEGNSKCVNLKDLSIGKTYTIKHRLNTFQIDKYISDYKIPLTYKDYKIEDIWRNYGGYQDNVDQKVEVLQINKVRPEYNDIVVLCKYIENNNFIYVPMTSLYTTTPTYTPRKFIYESLDYNGKTTDSLIYSSNNLSSFINVLDYIRKNRISNITDDKYDKFIVDAKFSLNSDEYPAIRFIFKDREIIVEDTEDIMSYYENEIPNWQLTENPEKFKKFLKDNFRPLPSTTPNYLSRKFVYEYNQWKDS